MDRGEIRPSLGGARRWALAVGLGLAAGIVGLALYLAAPSVEDKSIAVPPFRNLSSDPANAFFAEGVQDDILSRVVKIRDLKVISRLGASSYPADLRRDLRVIGRTLGVRHLLGGSLRRLDDRVRLHVALIDSRDGQEVWSEGYDRELADAINLQGELASDIADALDASLSPQERRDARFQSTRNPDAYGLFLQGRELEKNPAFEISAYKAAETLYSQAVVVDPGFALAHARVAITLGLLYRFRGPSEELKARVALKHVKPCGSSPIWAKLILHKVFITIEWNATLTVPYRNWKSRAVFSPTTLRRKSRSLSFTADRVGGGKLVPARRVLFPVIHTIKSMSTNCTLLPASSAIGLPQPNMLIVPWLSRRKWVR